MDLAPVSHDSGKDVCRRGTPARGPGADWRGEVFCGAEGEEGGCPLKTAHRLTRQKEPEFPQSTTGLFTSYQI